MARTNRHSIQEFLGRTTTWVHVGEASAANLRELGHRFAFQENDLREVLPSLQHTKCIVRPQYIFMVLLFPVYDHSKGMVRETELDVFLNEHTLVTVNHGNELTPLVAFLDELTSAAKRELVLSTTPADVVLNFIDRIYKSIFPLLVQLSHDITAVENRLFNDYERADIISRVLYLKTGNGRARKAIQNHKNTLLTLKNALPSFFSTNSHHEHLDHLINETTYIWNTLESQRESIDYIHSTNETLLSYRINEIMKTLTIFSVIVFPLTLIAAIFGMNVIDGMPFLHDKYGFWTVLILMCAGAVGMLAIFKAKRWL